MILNIDKKAKELEHDHKVMKECLFSLFEKVDTMKSEDAPAYEIKELKNCIKGVKKEIRNIKELKLMIAIQTEKLTSLN